MDYNQAFGSSIGNMGDKEKTQMISKGSNQKIMKEKSHRGQLHLSFNKVMGKKWLRKGHCRLKDK